MTDEIRAIEITEKERQLLISHLTDELPVLRMKLGTSQDELANLVGISRQTYSSIETKRRKMSWSTFLSLILVFDSNESTHAFLRKAGLFPKMILKGSGASFMEQPLLSFIQIDSDDIRSHLDEQALHAIEAVIMVEYARCNNMTGDAVIKAFDGKRITQVSDMDITAKKALDRIKADQDSQL